MKKKTKPAKYPGERELTEAEILAAAKSDPDNPPATAAQLRRARRVPMVKRLRQDLALTQESFAATYGIPLGTLRDWEQGRSEPDAPAQAYLRVIKANPKTVAKLHEAA